MVAQNTTLRAGAVTGREAGINPGHMPLHSHIECDLESPRLMILAVRGKWENSETPNQGQIKPRL